MFGKGERPVQARITNPPYDYRPCWWGFQKSSGTFPSALLVAYHCCDPCRATQFAQTVSQQIPANSVATNSRNSRDVAGVWGYDTLQKDPVARISPSPCHCVAGNSLVCGTNSLSGDRLKCSIFITPKAKYLDT